MFAALSENLEFFKAKINICLMLAPVTRVDRLTSGSIKKLKDSDTFFSFIEKS